MKTEKTNRKQKRQPNRKPMQRGPAVPLDDHDDEASEISLPDPHQAAGSAGGASNAGWPPSPIAISSSARRRLQVKCYARLCRTTATRLEPLSLIRKGWGAQSME
jgi:hypothetical protein